MNQYSYKSAIELSNLIREGKATSTNIVKEHLERIKEHNNKINALISIFEQEALQEAAMCDKEASEGKFRGPLHGVPITIKESFWIKGKKSNMNFNMLKDFVAPEDAVIVDKIKKSGAIILGQTNVPKNLLDYQVAGDIYPEGKNPYNTEYSPGGSTGGGAAALAAGFTPLELGSDLGGSIRIPANFCGLYGLKPTDRTVPVHGIIPLPKNAKTIIMHMANAGPLARTIEDVELLWKIIVGPHEGDRSIPKIQWDIPVKNLLSDYKIAWTDGWPGFETSSQVSQSIKEIAAKLKTNGCNIENKIPDETLHHESLVVMSNLFPYVISQGTSWLVRFIIKQQLLSGFLKGSTKEFPEMINKGPFPYNFNHFGETMFKKALITERWEKFFNEYDFLICPVGFGPSFKRCKIGTKLNYDGKEMIYIKYVWPYNACFNASGNPSITIPLGLGKEGLPIGIQIVGKHWSEPELIHFAKKVATFTEGFIKPNGF